VVEVEGLVVPRLRAAIPLEVAAVVRAVMALSSTLAALLSPIDLLFLVERVV
jgi:hypothetical protein